MKSKILRLPEPVINQIAAGEVVENPASIVKELIENSLDAGAKNISVDIVHGGQQLIRIEDDGCGMGPEDAVLCLQRYATSKIRAVEDLQSLITMGFRGEALAAIASVSQLELRTSDGLTGTRILADGGAIKTVEPCARNQGTTIEIRSLFYNIPARKKFQKSAKANAAQVTRIVELIALAHPECSFSMNGTRKWAISDWKERIEEILGPFEHEVKEKSIFGFIAAPEKAISTRMGQYLFINRRPIFSPLIAKAVKEGFGTRIGEHAYPPFVLFLEVAPDEIDVNVHPQKKEVRFKEEGALFRLVQEAVEKSFSPITPFLETLSFTAPSVLSFAETAPQLPFRLSEEKEELPLIFPERPLTLVGNYFLLQKEDLILVDLKAAHARILFETLKYEKGVSQALIWPLEIPLYGGEEEIAEKLQKIGIECRVLQKMLVVDALPPFLEAAHFADFFACWREEEKIERIATHYCLSLKKNFSFDEGNFLWHRLQKCRDCLYDPLGNRIWVKIDSKMLRDCLR